MLAAVAEQIPVKMIAATMRLTIFLFCANVLFAQGAYDLVLKGGRLIDPKNKISDVRDVAIRDGKVAAQGAPANILRAVTLSAVDPSASFENVFEGVLEPWPRNPGAARLRLPQGGVLQVPILQGPPVGRAVFGLPPEDILISAAPLERVSARNDLFDAGNRLAEEGGEHAIRPRVRVCPDSAYRVLGDN